MIDISKLGFRVLLKSPLVPGAVVLTILHSVRILGIVRHCEKTCFGAFTVGVEITEVVPELQASPASSALVNKHSLG
jgi:hypothetical protein